MSAFKEYQGTVRVPKGAGVDGFLLALREILRRPRVQGIHIDARGTIQFTYIGREDEGPLPSPEIQFETVSPLSVIRSGDVVEVPEQKIAAHAVAALYRAASDELLYPVAFVVGTGTSFWKWHEQTTGIALNAQREDLYGYPLFYDKQVPEHVLILCTAYMRGGSLLDTRKSFKINMPQLHELPDSAQGEK